MDPVDLARQLRGDYVPCDFELVDWQLSDEEMWLAGAPGERGYLSLFLNKWGRDPQSSVFDGQIFTWGTTLVQPVCSAGDAAAWRAFRDLLCWGRYQLIILNKIYMDCPLSVLPALGWKMDGTLAVRHDTPLQVRLYYDYGPKIRRSFRVRVTLVGRLMRPRQ